MISMSHEDSEDFAQYDNAITIYEIRKTIGSEEKETSLVSRCVTFETLWRYSEKAGRGIY